MSETCFILFSIVTGKCFIWLQFNCIFFFSVTHHNNKHGNVVLTWKFMEIKSFWNALLLKTKIFFFWESFIALNPDHRWNLVSFEIKSTETARPKGHSFPSCLYPVQHSYMVLLLRLVLVSYLDLVTSLKYTKKIVKASSKFC